MVFTEVNYSSLLNCKINFEKIIRYKTKAKQNSFIKSIILATLPFVIVLYSTLFTTYNLKLDKKIVEIENLPMELNNIKIIHLADFHSRNVYEKSYFKDVVEMVNQQNPDMIFITGDFVSFEYSELEQISPYLKKLNSKYGIFSCNGNHEHYDEPQKMPLFIRSLSKIGIRHLINEGINVNVNNYHLQIAAIDDINSKHNYGNLTKTLENIDTNKFIILLAHNPDIWEDSVLFRTNINLTLSGHTHGGQYGIRFDGITLTPIMLLHKYIFGLHKKNSQLLHITDGIGTSGAPMRFGIKPKVSLIILRRKDV